MLFDAHLGLKESIDNACSLVVSGMVLACTCMPEHPCTELLLALRKSQGQDLVLLVSESNALRDTWQCSQAFGPLLPELVIECRPVVLVILGFSSITGLEL